MAQTTSCVNRNIMKTDQTALHSLKSCTFTSFSDQVKVFKNTITSKLLLSYHIIPQYIPLEEEKQ